MTDSESAAKASEGAETKPNYEVPKTAEIDPRQLWYGMLDVQSVNYDWSAHEVGTDWEPYEAVECDECGHVSGDPSEEQCPQGHDLPAREGPMMSYYYSLPGFHEDAQEAAKRIVDLPLCLVYFVKEAEGADYALALTGGGMDLRWEICEAFIRLGYYPPVNLADLPEMSGRGTSPRDRVIVRACLRSFAAVAENATRGAKNLRAMMARARTKGAR